MKHLSIIILLLLTALCGVSASELGVWTHYLSYNHLTHVVPTDGSVFAVSDGRLFAYNPNDESLTSYSTQNLLSDNGDITDICWNKQTKCLVVAYANGNIDMIDTRNYSVVNASAILNETTTRSKEIMSITCNGIYAYVVMPYGVITINTRKREFDTAYRFNDSNAFYGAMVRNDSLFLVSDSLLAQYDNCNVIAAPLSANLLDRTQWKGILAPNSNAVQTSILATVNGRRIYNYKQPTRKNTDPVNDSYHNCYWTVDDDSGTLMKLSLQDDGSYQQLWQSGRKPDGPSSNSFYHIHWLNDRLYTASEGWRTKNAGLVPGAIQMYKPSTGWAITENMTTKELGFEFYSVSDVEVDPRDTAHVVVAAKSGLYEYYHGKCIKRWYNANSPIKAINNGTDPGYQMVLAAKYDKNGTLWVLNTYCHNSILRLDETIVNGEITDTAWQYMPHKELDEYNKNYEHYLANARWDDNGNLWFINLNYNGVAYYRYNTATDELTTYTPYYNQDGTTIYDNSGDNFLRDINIDNEGNVWLCGTKGLCYLPKRQIDTATNTVEQYKIARNDGTGLADYLLSTIDANCIVFDSAGRKYIGTTDNGLFIISADNNTQLQNYTVQNSALLSNNVRGLAIDELTGTLYCATERGLCSVTTDAVTVPSSLNESNVRVYPNPVSPSYSGMITIDGLTIGAEIKITTATGYVVHQGHTQSAMYQWDGCDASGNRCASGVYNVLIATADASEGCVAKIAMVK